MSANNVNSPTAPTTTTQATATIKSRPNIMPSSYLYTSSSGLLNRTQENKPTPPPTLPKYTSSFNAGNSLNRDRDKDSIGGSYRLSSLDRLAMRQKFMDQNNTTPTSNGSPTQTNGNGTDSALASKREMFFNNTSTDNPANKDSNRLNKVPSVEKPPEPPAKPSPEREAPSKEENSKDAVNEIIKERPKPKELDGYVGFANLPNQVIIKININIYL